MTRKQLSIDNCLGSYISITEFLCVIKFANTFIQHKLLYMPRNN